MDSTYSPPAWFGFVLGILGGFAVSAGLVGVLIGYSMGGGVFGAAQYAQVPPAAPSDVPPAPQAPAVPAAKVDATKDHIRGNVKAPVSLIVYSDFECPFCKRFKPTTDQVLAEYGDKVNVVFRHFPLSFHQNAQKEAEASECVAELAGNDAFWKFHDYIFDKTTSNGVGFALDQLPVAAKASGVTDEAKFKSCLDSGKYAQKVADQTNEGTNAGVTGTPGNFIVMNATNEQKQLMGAMPFENFKTAIDSMLGK